MELLNKWDIESKWDKRVVETKSATNTIISKFFILNPIPSFKSNSNPVEKGWCGGAHYDGGDERRINFDSICYRLSLWSFQKNLSIKARII